MQDKQKVTLYLPPSIHRQLRIRSAIEVESMSSIVEKAIEFYLKYPDEIEAEDESTFGKTHKVHICPECDALMVFREPTSRGISISFSLFPEQYVQLRLTANSVSSWKALFSQIIDFEQKIKAQSIAFNNELKTVYDSLNKTNVQEFLGNSGQAWYIRGILLTGFKRYEEAISSFDIVLKINPSNQKAWYKRGIAYYAVDFYEEAIKNFNKALELEPNDYLSWYSLGKSCLELEDNKKAIECFDKSLEINEDFVLARLAKMENKQKISVILRQNHMVSLKTQPNVVTEDEDFSLDFLDIPQEPDVREIEFIMV